MIVAASSPSGASGSLHPERPVCPSMPGPTPRCGDRVGWWPPMRPSARSRPGNHEIPAAENGHGGSRLRQEVFRLMEERGWPFIEEIGAPDIHGTTRRYDFGVPFLTGPSPDSKVEYIMFEIRDLPYAYYGVIFNRLEQAAMSHTGLTVLITRQPVAGRIRRGVYRCDWGEFPKLQDIITARFPIRPFRSSICRCSGISVTSFTRRGTSATRPGPRS